MRFEHEGRSLWFGTADAPLAAKAKAGVETVINIGVWPVDPSNRVELLYSVNRGPVKSVAASWVRNDSAGKAQYFRASLPGFHTGDTVEYIPICTCVGRQVPSPDEARSFAASFQVSEIETMPPPALTARELVRMPSRVFDQPKPDVASAQPSGLIKQPEPLTGRTAVPSGARIAPPGGETLSAGPRPNGSPSKVAPPFDASQTKGPADLSASRTLQYAGLAGLDQRTGNKLLDLELTSDRLNETTLTNLVNEGVISESQKSELHLTLELGKLTGDNFPFINSLKSKGVKSTADLLDWTREDWNQLIAKERISLPPGETTESYSEKILLNLERTYPSQLLLNSLLSDWRAKLALVDTAAKSSPVTDPPAKSNKTAKNGSQPQKGSQNELDSFANTYRYLGTQDLINDKKIDPSHKKNTIADRLQLLDSFHQNNPGLDLRFVDFFNANGGNLNWANIPSNERPLLRKQLMAFQRVLNLAESTADRQKLLGRGYDSSMAIAAKTEDEFMRSSGLSSDTARMTYARSQETALGVALDLGAIQDVTRGGFANIGMNNLPDSLINDLREIDGFDDLFGPQGFCDCQDCKSILGPAAYFVDLMSFIERHVSDAVFPVDSDSSLYLKNRRGDLWSLPLTCENTHSLIPYLTIVNEVLETYLNKVVSGDIFQRLSSGSEKSSFALPFNQPLAELRLYLGHFGINLHIIYAILKKDAVKVWRERLKLSAEEFHLITNPDLAGVRFRYGNQDPQNNIYVSDSKNTTGQDERGFINYAGITRKQLDELLTIRFNPDLANIVVEKQAVANEFQSFPEFLENLNASRLDFIHRFIRLWRKTDWTIPELDLVLTTMKQAGIMGTDFSRRPVEPVEPINYLARLIDVQEKLNLTIEEVCGFIDETPAIDPNRKCFASLPVSGEFPNPPAKIKDRRLYERIFDLKQLFEIDPVTHRREPARFHHYSLDRRPTPDLTIDTKTPSLLGGLGVSETELLLLFDLLRDYMPFDNNGYTTLGHPRISLLYRHSRLAKALKLSIEDFIQALRLNFVADRPVVTTLDQIRQLIEFKDWLKLSPFTVSELRLILKREDTTSLKFKTTSETIVSIVRQVQSSQVWIKANVESVGGIVQKVQHSQSPDPVEELRSTLSTVLSLTSDQLNIVLNSINTSMQSPEIQTALNATFTDGRPDNSADLKALLDLVKEMELVLNAWRIVQEAKEFEPADRVERLKTSLARIFKVTSDHLSELLSSLTIDLNNPAIQTALDTNFTAGAPDNTSNLTPLLDLIKELDQALRIEALKASLSRTFNVSAGQLEDTLHWINGYVNSAGISTALSATFSGSGPDNPADLGALLSLMNEIERVQLIFNNLKLKEESVAYITSNPAHLGINDLRALTLDHLESLTFYKKLIALEDETKPVVHVLLDEYQTSRTFADGARLADLWKQDQTLIESVLGALTLDPVPVKALEYVWQVLNVCQTLGVNGYSLQKLGEDADFSKLSAARDVALGAFSSKYDDEKVRQEQLEPYQDRNNVMKRDAMGDYIIAREQQLNFKDLGDVYSFFLLDVEMSGCFRTSRVVAALSSLQLYVHRVLANLEQSASTGLVVLAHVDEREKFRREWEWRKNYRIWEANRKVFLYPENYIEPDLRDNKTFNFKQLEDELLQKKITRESAEDAYRKYVVGLTELAKLRIVGSCYEQERDRYYFFGRTHSQPYQYFYRTFELGPNGKNVWGNWIKMEVAIEAGEISAMVYLRRLYVFWTQVDRRELSQIVEAKMVPGGYVFKVFAKYSYLNEHGKWCAPQKAYVGYIHFLDEVIKNRFMAANATLSDEDRNVLLERFQEEVFRKPYPVDHSTADPGWPIRLYFIWTHDNPAQIPLDETEESQDYETEVYEETFDDIIVNWAREHRDGEADATRPGQKPTYHCSPEMPPAHVRLDRYRIHIANNYPVHQTVNWKLNGNPQTGGELTLSSPTHCTVKVTFPPPSRDPGCRTDNRLEQQWKEITVPVARAGSNSGSQTSYSPKVSGHDLSLATTSIRDAGRIVPKPQTALNAQFLQKEFEAAYGTQTPAGYVQDGTVNFTAQERAFYYRQWDYCELILPDLQGGISLTTILVDELSRRIFATEIETFLSLATQTMANNNQRQLDFAGSYGVYYTELFFHIPFLVANHLNANQNFQEAKWWYERIFDPTSTEVPDPQYPQNRNWRYREFRREQIDNLQTILTDDDAITRYKEDPFNPHAIARMRLTAYQKSIVMKFIDNLIDWGDYLFAQDSMESINEATMLYVLAADILGKRPVKLGTCETAGDQQLTYEHRWQCPMEQQCDNSEFLVYLENWHLVHTIALYQPGFTASRSTSRSSRSSTSSSRSSGGSEVFSETFTTGTKSRSSSKKQSTGVMHFNSLTGNQARYSMVVTKWGDITPNSRFPIDVATQTTLAFCVPPNTDLWAYWDRVEDRLFKIRHCMNISGVRRELALFQPPINPMLLVRARAAGLSLEDILAMLAAPIPRYRFNFLIEKAKQFTQTVQSFGSALLAALEKRDVEELTLLRSVHEREILRMTKEIKKQQVKEAQHQYQSMVENRTNVKNRINYYNGLLVAGLTGWEEVQEASTHLAGAYETAASTQKLIGAILYLLPQVGSVFAMKYGGVELGNNAQAIGLMLSSLASISHAVAASASLEAGFQRRRQEWENQLTLARQEYKQLDQLVLAADVRQDIAARDLEVHEKNIEQADELDEFYKNKFTNLGLYDYLSTTLTRLYREAYNLAHDMARMTEKAYQFERDDETALFIASDNWQFDKAGLLAGERLILQLQRLEKAYLEQNSRDYELNQSFSLALIDPLALVTLKETGSCEFTIPEILFDLFYPGQYRRLIKSVRVSVPCVAGPFTNISAKLTLKRFAIRRTATTGPLEPITPRESNSIATSSGQSDGGLFELNFRDERYLPFEGAGAVESRWGLELPSKLRLFDYDTISDVIVHISYTARDGGAFRGTIEDQIGDALTEFATANSLYRLLSLKHEFPNAFYRLLNPVGTDQSTTFDVNERHFPHFITSIPVDPDDRALGTRNLDLSDVTILLKPKGEQPVETNGLTMRVNNTSGTDGWGDFGENLKQLRFLIPGSPVRPWTISAGNGLDKEQLDDVLVLLRYNVG